MPQVITHCGRDQAALVAGALPVALSTAWSITATRDVGGNSYRMRQHTELWHALHADSELERAPARRRRARQEVPTA